MTIINVYNLSIDVLSKQGTAYSRIHRDLLFVYPYLKLLIIFLINRLNNLKVR